MCSSVQTPLAHVQVLVVAHIGVGIARNSISLPVVFPLSFFYNVACPNSSNEVLMMIKAALSKVLKTSSSSPMPNTSQQMQTTSRTPDRPTAHAILTLAPSHENCTA